MIRLSKDKVLQLHQLIARQSGGSADLRDEGLLYSALEGAFQTFDGVDLYPSIEEKGARLGFSLVSNHAFVDGNKRIGIYVLLTFLEVNGIALEATDDELVEIGLSIASDKMNYDRLLRWIYDHELYI